MPDVSREEFSDLVRQVRSLERKVDSQQQQIATLKRRTSTDAGGGSTETEPESSGSVSVPRTAIQLDIIDILKANSAGEEAVEVDIVKNEAAQLGHLRSGAKSVVRKWIKEGYLVGDLDDTVKVSKWPSETTPA